MTSPRFVLDSSGWESIASSVRPRGLWANNEEFAQSVFAGFLKRYMPQKHLVQVNLREKLNFHDFYFQLRSSDYEDLTMIKSEIFYCIKISKKLSKIICFMQNHELLIFYCGHQSKEHRQKWVSTNRQLIVANLIYMTLYDLLFLLCTFYR